MTPLTELLQSAASETLQAHNERRAAQCIECQSYIDDDDAPRVMVGCQVVGYFCVRCYGRHWMGFE